MMISKSEAKKAAHSYLNSRSDLKRDFTLVIVDEYTIEKEYGYIFFYDSSKHIETGDVEYALAGNAPILIDKLTGCLYVTGTAYPIEHYLENYEKYGVVELSE